MPEWSVKFPMMWICCHKILEVLWNEHCRALTLFDDLYNQIEEGIVSDQKDNEATKKELQEARQIRMNKMEYGALAAIIQTQPDRKSTQEKWSLLR